MREPPCRRPQALQPPLVAAGPSALDSTMSTQPQPETVVSERADVRASVSWTRPPRAPQPRGKTRTRAHLVKQEECGARAWAGGGSRKSLCTCLALTGSRHSQSAFQIGATPAPSVATIPNVYFPTSRTSHSVRLPASPQSVLRREQQESGLLGTCGERVFVAVDPIRAIQDGST